MHICSSCYPWQPKLWSCCSASDWVWWRTSRALCQEQGMSHRRHRLHRSRSLNQGRPEPFQVVPTGHCVLTLPCGHHLAPSHPLPSLVSPVSLADPPLGSGIRECGINHQALFRSQATGVEGVTPAWWEDESQDPLHTHLHPCWSPGPSHAQPQSPP